jgi:hypothetical protein
MPGTARGRASSGSLCAFPLGRRGGSIGWVAAGPLQLPGRSKIPNCYRPLRGCRAGCMKTFNAKKPREKKAGQIERPLKVSRGSRCPHSAMWRCRPPGGDRSSPLEWYVWGHRHTSSASRSDRRTVSRRLSLGSPRGGRRLPPRRTTGCGRTENRSGSNSAPTAQPVWPRCGCRTDAGPVGGVHPFAVEPPLPPTDGAD